MGSRAGAARLVCCGLVLMAGACSEPVRGAVDVGVDGGSPDVGTDAVVARDAATDSAFLDEAGMDSAVPGDAGIDSTVPDASVDSATADTGLDGGMPDTGVDAGIPDTGVDGGMPDTGVDGGMPDTGVAGGMPDTGVDGGMPDTGVDAGAPGAVVINEMSVVMPDWVEVVNAGAPRLLTGCTLTNATSGASTTFPSGFVLGTGERILFLERSTARPGVQTSCAIERASITRCLDIVWNVASGATTTLTLACAGTVLDTAVYSGGGAVPEGSSWCRIPDAAGAFMGCTETAEAAN